MTPVRPLASIGFHRLEIEFDEEADGYAGKGEFNHEEVSDSGYCRPLRCRGADCGSLRRGRHDADPGADCDPSTHERSGANGNP